MLLRPPPRCPGLPREGFSAFAVRDREERRHAIIEAFHPALRLLADDLLPVLDEGGGAPFHAHLPQLNWPKGYVPFCTWLTVSRQAHGYQAGPQLGVGVHADHVVARLGWDTSADAFGRFEFLCRLGGLAPELLAAAREVSARIRVYASAPWPAGSRLTFESSDDLAGSFDEVRRRGVFWELGRRWEIPASLDRVTEPQWTEDVRDVLLALKPIYERST
jgi:hypothetical protein